MSCPRLACNLRQTLEEQGCAANLCQSDRATRWVPPKTATCSGPRCGAANASAKFRRRGLLPVIEQYRHLDISKFFRDDATFASPALYRLLEREGYRYAICLRANAGSGAQYRASSDPSCGPTIAQAEGLLLQFFSIKRNRGSKHAAWWSRSSGTQVSCTRAWASSLPT